MKQIFKGIASVFFAVLLIVACFYFIKLGKSFGYSTWYEDEVRATVREMVKPEHLKP